MPFTRIYNHISLGEVRWLCTHSKSNKAICFTVADNIRYEIDLIDLIDY